MKNLLFLLSLGLIFSCTSQQAETASVDTEIAANTATKSNQLSIESSGVQDALPQTSLKWDKVTHDFGNITEGEVVETTFTVTNTGSNPLIINNAKGSCGCTVPKVEKNVPIAPGESTDIQVRFNSKGRPGKNSKNVTLTGNFDQAVATITATVAKDPSAPAATTAAPATPSVDPHAGHNH